jgi:hypothetical protein
MGRMNKVHSINNKELIVRGFIDNQLYEMQTISVVKENK